MKLELYLDMRLVSSYEALWGDVQKQFLKRSDVLSLERAIETMRFFIDEKTLGRINSEQKAALEMAVSTDLREKIAEMNLESGILEGEQVGSIADAMTRVALLCKNWDITGQLEESDAIRPTSIINIAKSVLERGQNGFQNEDRVRKLL